MTDAIVILLLVVVAYLYSSIRLLNSKVERLDDSYNDVRDQTMRLHEHCALHTSPEDVSEDEEDDVIELNAEEVFERISASVAEGIDAATSRLLSRSSLENLGDDQEAQEPPVPRRHLRIKDD